MKDFGRTPTSAGQGKTGPGRTLGNGPGAEREPLAVLQSPAESSGSGEDGGYDVGICRLAVISVDTRGCLLQVRVFDLKSGTGSGPVKAGSVCLGGGVDIGCVPHTSSVIGSGVLCFYAQGNARCGPERRGQVVLLTGTWDLNRARIEPGVAIQR